MQQEYGPATTLLFSSPVSLRETGEEKGALWGQT
jgi:hypothetical protein